jgi:hypothetical protein
LAKSKPGSDVAVLSGLEYIYLVQYASPALASNLHYVAPENDLLLGGYRRLIRETHADLKVEPRSEFLKNHDHFMMYAPLTNAISISPFVDAGYDLKAIDTEYQGILLKCDKQ